MVHLHTHSHYSFLYGLPSPADLARAAVEGGMDTLALTDHHGLTGAVEFHDACRASGVRPIFGLELRLNLPAAKNVSGNLVLLAMDMTGWRNLCRISAALQTAPRPPIPPVDSGGQEGDNAASPSINSPRTPTG